MAKEFEVRCDVIAVLQVLMARRVRMYTSVTGMADKAA
jgi:hypothetical protein